MTSGSDDLLRVDVLVPANSSASTRISFRRRWASRASIQVSRPAMCWRHERRQSGSSKVRT